MKEEDAVENCVSNDEDSKDNNSLQPHPISCKSQKKRISAQVREKLNKKFGIIETSEGKSYPCQHCTKVFTLSSTRSAHTRRVHEGRRPHKCDTCTRAFHRPSELISHTRTHTGDRPFVCYLCNKGFTLPHALKRHVQRHLKPKLKENHKNVVFSESNQKRYKCDVCNLLFARKTNLTRHMIVHTGYKSQECNFCEKSFSKKETLDSHIRKLHSKPRIYPCRFCKKSTFYTHKELVVHQRTHNGQKPYSCDLCDMSFTVKCNLRRHVQSIHLNPDAKGKPLQPDSSTRHVQEHPEPKLKEKYGKNVVSLGNGHKRYKCDTCNMLFTTNNSLTQHFIVHTGSKPHECNFCGDSFSESMTLESHVRKIHSEQKAYPCRFCRKTCSNDRTLRSHLRKHCEDLYICSACSYSTYEEDSLKKHEKTHGADGNGVKPKRSPQQIIGSTQIIIKAETETFSKCELCPSPKYFTDTDDLEAHLVSCHIESENAMDESSTCGYKDQECEYEHSCGSEDPCRSEHVVKAELIPEDTRAQTREKRYRCRFCGKIYAHQFHLESHLRVSHGEPFNHELCSYSTDGGVNLKGDDETTDWKVEGGRTVVPPTFRFVLDGEMLFAKALHTGREGMRNYFCKKCRCTFRSDEELCVHYSLDHKLPTIVIQTVK